jgi:hypothetical protein
MPAKKGTKPPNAGKRGRKPGTPNVVTRTTRELFSAFVDHNAAKAQQLFDRVARKNPAMALRILSSFSDFVLPRMQRTEMDLKTNAPTTYPSMLDMDPTDAARAYQELMRPGSNIEFLPPVKTEAQRKAESEARYRRIMGLNEDGTSSEAQPAAAVVRPKAQPVLSGPQEPMPAGSAAATVATAPKERATHPRPRPMGEPVDQDSVVLTVEHEEDARLRHLRKPYVLT